MILIFTHYAAPPSDNSPKLLFSPSNDLTVDDRETSVSLDAETASRDCSSDLKRNLLKTNDVNACNLCFLL